MTQQIINRGGAPGDGTGDTAYGAFGKANSNFSELYAASSAGPPIQVSSYTTLGSSTFLVPSTVKVIYLTGCGGGGGGAGGFSGGATAGGGGGGGPAPMIWLLPLTVTSGATLTTFVGTGGAAGAAGADGADGTESYISGSGILSPFKNASDQILMGYGLKGKAGAAGSGGDGGGSQMCSTAPTVYGTLNTGTGHASRWWYVGDGFVGAGYLLPICQGSGGGAQGANGGSRGAAGFISMGGAGLGNPALGSASGGGGGAGGGGGYGLGGAGGVAGGASPAGTASGFGAGGGGGGGTATGTGGAGSAGRNGFLEIWY